MKKVIVSFIFVLLCALFCVEADAASLKTKTSIVSVKPGSGKVNIKWKKSGKKPSGYQVYRRNSSSSWKKIATTKRISFSDKKVKARTTYYYKVRAYRKKKAKRIYSKFSKAKSIYIKVAAPSVQSYSPGYTSGSSSSSGGASNKPQERKRYSYDISIINPFPLYNYSTLPSIGVFSADQVKAVMAKDTFRQFAVLYVKTDNPDADQFDRSLSYNKSSLQFRDHATGDVIWPGYWMNFTIEYPNGVIVNRGFEENDFVDVNYIHRTAATGCSLRGRKVRDGYLFTINVAHLSPGNEVIDLYEGGEFNQSIDLNLQPAASRLNAYIDEMIAGGLRYYNDPEAVTKRRNEESFWKKRIPTLNQNYFKLCAVRDYIRDSLIYSPCVGTSMGNQPIFTLANYGRFFDNREGGCEVGAITMSLCAAKMGIRNEVKYQRGHCVCLLTNPVEDLGVLEAEANDWCKRYDATPHADGYYDMDSDQIAEFYSTIKPIL